MPLTARKHYLSWENLENTTAVISVHASQKIFFFFFFLPANQPKERVSEEAEMQGGQSTKTSISEFQLGLSLCTPAKFTAQTMSDITLIARLQGSISALQKGHTPSVYKLEI